MRSEQRVRRREATNVQRVVLFIRQLSGSVVAHGQERLQRDKGNVFNASVSVGICVICRRFCDQGGVGEHS